MDASMGLEKDEFSTAVNDGLTIIQKKDGLLYGTDALLLASYARRVPQGVAVDLGAGSGIISLLCVKRDKFVRIHAVEVQPEFADLIARNAASNGLSERVEPLCCNVTALVADSFGEQVDAVFTNPPFMKADGGRKNEAERKFIARHEACGTVADFCAAAGRVLRWGGAFYAVYRPDRMNELFSAMTGAGIEPKRLTMVAQTPDHEPSLLLVEGKRGAKPGMKVTKTLFLANADGGDSEDMKTILERGDFDERYR